VLVGRLERLAVAVVAIIVLAAHAWAGQFGIDPVDEGYFLSLADRVRQGGLPYRDFDTYYTPGIFYLYAAAFDLCGPTLTPIRWIIAVQWSIFWLLLYGLARRVVSPAFAVLPFAVLASVEPSPHWPAVHPGWMSLLAALLALEMVTRHHQSGRVVWIAAAGAAAALGFVFKQNVGAFTAIGIAGYIALRPRLEGGTWLSALRVAFVASVGIAVMLVLRLGDDPLFFVTLLLPLVATLLVLMVRGHTLAGAVQHGAYPGSLVAEAALAGGAFLIVTLLWLVPLMVALGPEHTPFALFLGSVNQGALFMPIGPPPRGAHVVGLVAIWLPAVVALIIQRWHRRVWRSVLTTALPVSALVIWLPTLSASGEAVQPTPGLRPLIVQLDAELGWLYLYLPAISAWAALAWSRGGRALVVGPLGWYLLFGTLVALAIYPRVDLLHAMMAGPPLFVIGAWVLARAHRALTAHAGRIGKALVFVALLSLPVAAATPYTAWRIVSTVRDDPYLPELATYVPLGVERASVLVKPRTALEIGGAVNYVRAHTSPGDTLFAFPMLPIVNFLADRPNPARFNHFLAKALTHEDMANVVASLKANPPPYIVWDHAGIIVWQAEPANRIITDYIWQCYEQVDSFGLVLILQRRPCS
jgi:hypothetical protein